MTLPTLGNYPPREKPYLPAFLTYNLLSLSKWGKMAFLPVSLWQNVELSFSTSTCQLKESL